jgi:primosomal protein N'
MYVVHIIPLSRSAPSEPLSYRSTAKLAAGALVNVPLRRKEVSGVVVDCIPVQEAKAELKRASFGSLKSASKRAGSLPAVYIKAAEEIALYHATTFGAVLSSLLIPVLRENTVIAIKQDYDGQAIFDRLEAPQIDRFLYYRNLLEEYAGSSALQLVVPTEMEARILANHFKSFKPLVVTGSVTDKKRDALFAEVYKSQGLVITTPSFSWIPIAKLGRICIERVSAGGYTQIKRPHIDMRIALTEFAKARAIPITYGDYPLPIEYRKRPSAPLTIPPLHELEVHDVRNPEEEPKAWKAVPDELLQEIHTVRETGGITAVLTVRRGYAPVVVCRDCGTTVTDDFGRALTLATEHGERVLRSTDGSTIQAPRLLCSVCGGWNMIPLGIGSERVEEELTKAFPEAHIARIDQDATPAQMRKRIKEALETPGSIVIGTEVLLPLLSPENPIALGIIASADSLLALPFWRARERFVRVGLMLGERTEKTIVATRHPEDAALLALAAPTEGLFWQEETELRKILQYPPFGTLIMFQSEGSKARIAEAESYIRAAVGILLPTFLSPRPLTATTFRSTAVLQLELGQWPNAELSERLAHLPPTIRILMNSETLW